MTDAPFDRDTLDFYAREANLYAERASAKPNRHLPAFLARLAPGARILELGGGGGQDSAQMIAAGFDVDPTDGSPEMAAQAAAHRVAGYCRPHLASVAAGRMAFRQL